MEDAATLAAINMHIDNAWPRKTANAAQAALLNDFLSTIRKPRGPKRELARRSYRLKPQKSEEKSPLTVENGGLSERTARRCSRALFTGCACLEDSEREKEIAQELTKLLNTYLPPEYQDCAQVKEFIRVSIAAITHI